MEKERAFGVFGMVRPKYLKHRSVWNKSFSGKPKEAVPKSIYPHPRWDFLFEITAKSLQTYYETLRTRQMLHLSADKENSSLPSAAEINMKRLIHAYKKKTGFHQ